MSRLRCFTLFELMLAIALLGALVFTLLPAAHQVMGSSAAAADRSQRLSRLALLSDMVDRSMMTLLSVDADAKPGFELTESGLKLASCGVGMMEQSQHPDIQTLEIRHASGAVSVRTDGGQWQDVLEDVGRVEFVYHDGDDWKSETEPGGEPPVALAISIWFGQAEEPDEETEAFEAEPGVLARLDEEEDTDPDWRRVFAVFDPAGIEPGGGPG